MRNVSVLSLALVWAWFFSIHSVVGQEFVFSRNWTQRSDLTGSVVVRNGARLTVIDSAIRGDVYVEQGGSFVGSGARIEGSLVAVDANAVVLRNSAVRPSAVAGDLRLCRMTGRQRIFGAEVGGRLLIEECAATEIVVQGASIDGDLQLFENSVAEEYRISNNLILGSLQCGRKLDLPRLEGNSAAGGLATGSDIVLVAKGFSGGEKVALQVDQRTVCDWNAEAGFRNFRFRSDQVLTPDRIRVAVAAGPPLADDWTNGLLLDRLELDSAVYQTEHASVYSRGAAAAGKPLRPGFHQTESLPFNGFFQFGIDGVEDDFLLLQLNSALPDGWKFSLFRDSSNIRLKTFDAAGKAAFYARFGSTGVISSIEDTRSKKQLVAPPFKYENTDRVLQWTVWETGTRVVHNVSSLPWWEDRFNITQAGTSKNVYHGTAEVALNSARGQLDVWSVHDRQWKVELEPYIGGSLSALTRTNVLDGGGMLVRRVIRMNRVHMYGQPVVPSDPLFEAWSPFSDSTFNSLALELSSSGNPTWWYADSRDIPHYPGWPVLTTHGWALAYDRYRKSTGPTMAVVFGRDEGLVIWPDGKSTPPRSYQLNTMDFSGGLAILPGFWPGSLPEGSIIDLSFIFLPGYGIGSKTPEMLEDLASLVPAPRAYHPGAPMSGELSVIADRLSTLHTESQTRTDQLGTVK